MYLHWHSSRRDGHYLHNYFRSLADALDEFHYHPMNGPVSPASLDGLPDLSAVDVYLTGNEDFVGNASGLLLARGLPNDRLFTDASG